MDPTTPRFVTGATRKARSGESDVQLSESAALLRDTRSRAQVQAAAKARKSGAIAALKRSLRVRELHRADKSVEQIAVSLGLTIDQVRELIPKPAPKPAKRKPNPGPAKSTGGKK